MALVVTASPPYASRTTHLHVHHRTYARVGHERLEDLVLLCERCHLAAHLAALRCARCDEGYFTTTVDVFDEIESRWDPGWFEAHRPDLFDTARDELTWDDRWPYCDYCGHMLSKDD